MSRTSSPAKKPPVMPRHTTFSPERELIEALDTEDSAETTLISTEAELIELQRARWAADQEELVALRRRLGTWKPSALELSEAEQRAAFQKFQRQVAAKRQHAEGPASGSATVAAEASDPVAVGFELRPLRPALETLDSTLRPDNIGEARAHESEGGAERSSPSGAGTTPNSAGGTGRKPRPTSAKNQIPKQRPTSASSWKRQTRNRQGCSEEVRTRERRLLERTVESCGLLLEHDPNAPTREVLRAAPAPRANRSRQEQLEATHKLVRGMASTDRDPLLRPQSRPHSASSSFSGGSAARLLRAEKQRLAGDVEVEATTRQRPASANSRGSGSRGPPGVPLHVQGLPVAETAAILRAALAGAVPVHMTQGPSILPSAAGALDDEGEPPPAALQAAVLAAALKGKIPVRSISTASAQPWSSGGAKARAQQEQLYGFAAFNKAASKREFELEEPDQELAPRCEAADRNRYIR